MSKLKGLYLLFGPYEFWRVSQLAKDHNMTLCDYIHWLLSFEIAAAEDDEDDFCFDCSHFESAYEE